MMKSLFLTMWIAITSLLSSSAQAEKNCESLIGTCDFYLCLEADLKCGPSGYLINYGYKYCRRSLDSLVQHMQSDAGKFWVIDTIQCLQTKVTIALQLHSLTCREIESVAIQSHPDCYVDSGICWLPPGDKIRIFHTIKDQILKKRPLIQAGKTLELCAAKSMDSKH